MSSKSTTEQKNIDIQEIVGLGEIADNYDTFVIDLWGVMHNGVTVFPEAMRALQELRNASKTIAFLSNAPRRNSTAVAQLLERGIKRQEYDHIMTSGEFCHFSLKNDSVEAIQDLGKNCYHIGATKDYCLFTEIDLKKVEQLEESDFILNSGTPGWETDVTVYREFLGKAMERGMPMVCANTDMYVPYKGELAICAGAIAREYESIGGNVTYFGKPLKPIYQHLFEQIGASSERALMIGDSFETDIRGANSFGIDSLLVQSGLHNRDLVSQTVSSLAAKYTTVPTYTSPALAW